MSKGRPDQSEWTPLFIWASGSPLQENLYSIMMRSRILDSLPYLPESGYYRQIILIR
ncbi:hypothetical protein MC7420_7675 [Coleofasciculus chthonoplastes PCC 7420]|uniref:Uncharacterized protein n=1 Tax=Coleofasciculus chthonoplastes PCC 7420 TaxID=118168 RepID=B4VJ68_9CYAN|nr:hypothetical protein MC7420_7675 [Coleofasciculus chthonoplastes PCC 7420]